jgi:hypothetical protein
MNSEKTSVYLKRNKTTELFEYCLDNGISFSVTERAMGIDEFEIAMEVDSIKKAIQLGFFLRENRIDLAGAAVQENKSAVRKPVVKKNNEPAPQKAIVSPNPAEMPKAEPEPENAIPLAKTETTSDGVSLSFDLN